MESARSTTQQAVAALTPPAPSAVDVSFAPGKEPMHFALDALHFAQSYHRGSFRDNWILVAEKGMQLHRRQSPEISPLTPLHKGEKVLEGVTAEEVASVVCNLGCRKNWDDRFISGTVLQEYGADLRQLLWWPKADFRSGTGDFIWPHSSRGIQLIHHQLQSERVMSKVPLLLQERYIVFQHPSILNHFHRRQQRI